MVIESPEVATARWESHGYGTHSRKRYKKFMGICNSCGKKKFYPLGTTDSEQGMSSSFSLKAKLANIDTKPYVSQSILQSEQKKLGKRYRARTLNKGSVKR